MRASNIPKAKKAVGLRSGAINARFVPDEWEAMTPSQRIKRCTVRANEAIKLAQTASRPLAEAYLELAAQWLRLGQEIGAEEKQSAKGH